jgi:S1-C subfamily serine protease
MGISSLPQIRHLLSAALAIALAACAATQDVELEGRDISVEQNAEPAANFAMSQSIAGLVRAAGPSYVTLTVSQIDKQSSSKEDRNGFAVTSGSGFLVDSAGYVLTAGHVAVAKGNKVSARAANGRIYSGTVIDIRRDNDMALIKLRGYLGKAATPVADNCVARGATVFSLGKPHAQGDTARIGQLEAMHFGRAVQYGKYGYADAMVLRMSTQKGESGGPLFDEQGRLIGMVVSTLSDGNGRPLNLAHAVPATSLAGFLCSHIACTGNWTALSVQSTGDCSDN